MAKPNQTKPDKRVLLLPGHPVAQGYWRGLSEHYDLCFMYPQAMEYAASISLHAMALNQFHNSDAQESALNTSAQIAAKAVQSAQVVAGRLMASLDGSAPSEFNSAQDWWPGYVLQHAQAMALQYAMLTQLSNVREIAGCVVHEDVAPDTRGLVLWCKARGIPTIHVPHAACHLRPDGGLDIHRESRSDWILASGSYEHDFYVAGGHPADRIAIVGSPQMDGLYAEETLPNKAEARRVLDIDNDRVICYAGTWTQTTAIRGRGVFEMDEGLHAMITLAHEWEAVLVIKSHPNGGDDKVFEQALRKTNTPGIITKHYLSYALRAADVLIAQGPSNICVEAAILGTPSAYIQTEGFDYAHALPFRSGVDRLGVTALEAMDSRGDPAWQDFVTFYNAAHPDGGATDKVIEKVVELCQ